MIMYRQTVQVGMAHILVKKSFQDGMVWNMFMKNVLMIIV